ncbi:MAG: cation diffusion facilitator family transporter, partial [Candidatus Njordarchaeota archaeon]
MSEDSEDRIELEKARNMAFHTMMFLLSLFIGKLIVGVITGSIALIADSFNSLSDTLMIFAVFVSLQIIMRKPNGKFPYGYYRLEDIVSLMMSIGFLGLSTYIIWNGAESIILGYEGSKNFETAVLVELFAGFASLLFSIKQQRIAKKANVTSLSLSARDLQIDTLSAIFVAFSIYLDRYVSLPFEALATILVGILISTTAIRGLRTSVTNLLDIWNKPEIIHKIKRIINDTGKFRVGFVRLRRAGPFIFGEAIVYAPEELRLEDVDDILEDVEKKIRSEIRELQELVINVEPLEESKVICAIPIAERHGGNYCLASTFGSAKKFIIVEIDKNTNKILNMKEITNMYTRYRNPSIKITKKLVECGVDCILTRNIDEAAFEL